MAKETGKRDPIENRKQVFADIHLAQSILSKITLQNHTLSEAEADQLLKVCASISDGEKTTQCLAAQVKHECWFLDNTATKETSEIYAFRALIIAAILDSIDPKNTYISGINAILRHDLEYVSLDLLRNQAQEFVLRTFPKTQPFEAVALLSV